MFKTRNISLFNVRRIDSENMDLGVIGNISNYWLRLSMISPAKADNTDPRS